MSDVGWSINFFFTVNFSYEVLSNVQFLSCQQEIYFTPKAGWTGLCYVVPPSIAPGLTEVVVLKGEPVILECEAEGDPQPQVSWRKDGALVDTVNMADHYSLVGAGTLAIDASKVEDAVKYTCTATNPAGKQTRDIRLVVHGE